MSESTAPESRFRYYSIIYQPHDQRVLLLRDADGQHRLPQFALDKARFWQDVEHINRHMMLEYGLDVTTLRCMDLIDEDGGLASVYALEHLTPRWLPPVNAGWFSYDELAGLHFAQARELGWLHDWFAWLAEDHPQRVAWYKPGWFRVARAWLMSWVMAIPDSSVEIFTQMRSWQRSALLKALSSEGELVYFKAVPPVFAHELNLSVWLHHRFPRYFPQVLASSPERGWLLLEDGGRQSLDVVRDLTVWETVLRALAEIQLALSSEIATLAALGCPSQPLELLAGYVDTLLADDAALRVGGFLDDAAVMRLRAFAPRLKALCAELAACGVPHSLEHGDFYPGQVLVTQRQIRFIDWSDATITHPFFSFCGLEHFVLYEARTFAGQDDVMQRLRSAYLQPWRALAEETALERALELARPLASLHYATLYHRLILPGMEVQWEMHNMLPFWLRTLLRQLDGEE